mmetsp:Transcript_89597/g.161594  ORF Transcript_89597/g.161594 Transcript_89597/m.161594 type:complete len:300 (-) Transcript_89597:549-1448(-)
MHVVIDRLGHVVVNDILDILHVQAALGHVGGHKDVGLTRAELVQHGISLTLVLVPMDGSRIELLEAQLAAQGISRSLGVRENKDPRVAFSWASGMQPTEKALLLVQLGHHMYLLQNVWVRMSLCASNGELHGVLLAEIPCQVLDLLRPGRRPHQRLALGADLRHKPSELRFEAHVQHAVGLIHHKVGHAGQIGDLGVQEIQQSPGSGNYNLHSAAQLTLLTLPGHASIHDRVADAQNLAEAKCLHLNLQGQLASGGKHQRDGPIARIQRRLRSYVHKRRQQVSESLTTTSLCQSHHVVA